MGAGVQTQVLMLYSRHCYPVNHPPRNDHGPTDSQGVALPEVYILVRVGVALLEKVWVGWALRFQKLKPDPVSLCLSAA